jgi:hypothetical protein
MRILKRIICLCLLAGLAAGCGTTAIDDEYEGPADFFDREETGADFDRFGEE